ncbi:MAG: trehalose-phosphatase [Alphaproteobacteria bacterium]
MHDHDDDAPPPAQPDWAYFLDVDGTLIEIAARPEQVVVPPGLIELLRGLHRAAGGACALVSGRAIAELDRLFAPLRLPAAGVHGVEWRGDGACGDRPVEVGGDPETAAALDRARAGLAALQAAHGGLTVEDKGVALAVHYRAAPALAGVVGEATAALVAREPALCAQPGKMVVELKPAGVDKGHAIRRHLGEAPFRGRRPVYVGDDLTDEHGFAAVNAVDGISIRVGDGAPTLAHWHLASVAAVHRWLAALSANRG